jgi:hypothetical protein
LDHLKTPNVSYTLTLVREIEGVALSSFADLEWNDTINIK